MHFDGIYVHDVYFFSFPHEPQKLQNFGFFSFLFGNMLILQVTCRIEQLLTTSHYPFSQSPGLYSLA